MTDTVADTETSLFDQLKAAIVTSAINDTEFLPLDSLNTIITIDAITRNIPKAGSWVNVFWSYFWKDSTQLAKQIEQESKRVFTILVMISHVSSIEELLKDGLTDKHLPLARKDNTKVLLSRTTGKEFPSFRNCDPAMVSLFLEKQSIVQCPVFETVGQDLVFDDKLPLPFIGEGEKIGGGSGVLVHQVQIHPAHRSEAFALAAGGLVAVKEIRDKEAFITERGNLESMKKIPHKHLIQTLGTIEMGRLSYVIFPWAHGGDVRQFWERPENNPQDPELIKWSLEQMFGIANGIMTLHKNNIRHGDIKPQNVLHFKPSADGSKSSGLGTLVIADFGISKRHTQPTNIRNCATNTNAVTVSYEAPEAEYDRENGIPRSRKYDQWSLGCMYLECIVWLLYGFQAVEVFRKRRTTSREDPTTAPGNFFTQRSYEAPASIHSKVTKAIKELRKDPRCGEHTAFGDLLTLVDRRLLQIDPKARAGAEELSEKLQKIYTDADDDANYLCKPLEASPPLPKFFSRRHGRSSSSDTHGSRSSQSSIPSTATSARSSFSSVAAVEEEPLAENSG